MGVVFVSSLLCLERFFSGYSCLPLSSLETYDLIFLNLLISVYSVPVSVPARGGGGGGVPCRLSEF